MGSLRARTDSDFSSLAAGGAPTEWDTYIINQLPLSARGRFELLSKGSVTQLPKVMKGHSKWAPALLSVVNYIDVIS